MKRIAHKGPAACVTNRRRRFFAPCAGQGFLSCDNEPPRKPRSAAEPQYANGRAEIVGEGKRGRFIFGTHVRGVAGAAVMVWCSSCVSFRAAPVALGDFCAANRFFVSPVVFSFGATCGDRRAAVAGLVTSTRRPRDVGIDVTLAVDRGRSKHTPCAPVRVRQSFSEGSAEDVCEGAVSLGLRDEVRVRFRCGKKPEVATAWRPALDRVVGAESCADDCAVKGVSATRRLLRQQKNDSRSNALSRRASSACLDLFPG